MERCYLAVLTQLSLGCTGVLSKSIHCLSQSPTRHSYKLPYTSQKNNCSSQFQPPQVGSARLLLCHHIWCIHRRNAMSASILCWRYNCTLRSTKIPAQLYAKNKVATCGSTLRHLTMAPRTSYLEGAAKSTTSTEGAVTLCFLRYRTPEVITCYDEGTAGPICNFPPSRLA